MLEGESQRDGRASARLALEIDCAAVQRRDAFDDCQTKAEAAGLLRAGAVRAVEIVKDVWQVFGRNPTTGVADLDAQCVVFGRGAKRDPATGLRCWRNTSSIRPGSLAILSCGKSGSQGHPSRQTAAGSSGFGMPLPRFAGFSSLPDPL